MIRGESTTRLLWFLLLSLCCVAVQAQEIDVQNDTNGWVVQIGPGFCLITPPDWLRLPDLLSDAAQVKSVAGAYDIEADDFVRQVQHVLNNSAPDLFLVDPENATLAIISHEDRNNRPITTETAGMYWSFYVDSTSADLLTSAIVQLHTGPAVRIHARNQTFLQLDDQPADTLIYALVTDQRIYSLEFVTPPKTFTTREPLLSAVAAGFRGGWSLDAEEFLLLR